MLLSLGESGLQVKPWTDLILMIYIFDKVKLWKIFYLRDRMKIVVQPKFV